jgi:hypothetical protein
MGIDTCLAKAEVHFPCAHPTCVERQTQALFAFLKRLLSPIALGDVHEHVHRPEQVTGFIKDRIGVRQGRETLAIRAFNHDLVPVIFFAHLQRQGHPARVVGER